MNCAMQSRQNCLPILLLLPLTKMKVLFFRSMDSHRHNSMKSFRINRLRMLKTNRLRRLLNLKRKRRQKLNDRWTITFQIQIIIQSSSSFDWAKTFTTLQWKQFALAIFYPQTEFHTNGQLHAGKYKLPSALPIFQFPQLFHCKNEPLFSLVYVHTLLFLGLTGNLPRNLEFVRPGS